MVSFDAVVESADTDHPTLVVSGDLDLMTVPIFMCAANDALERHPQTTLQLDFRQVGFIDSTGISALVKLQSVAEERGGKLELAATSSYVERVLALVGLTEMFV